MVPSLPLLSLEGCASPLGELAEDPKKDWLSSTLSKVWASLGGDLSVDSSVVWIWPLWWHGGLLIWLGPSLLSLHLHAGKFAWFGIFQTPADFQPFVKVLRFQLTKSVASAFSKFRTLQNHCKVFNIEGSWGIHRLESTASVLCSWESACIWFSKLLCKVLAFEGGRDLIDEVQWPCIATFQCWDFAVTPSTGEVFWLGEFTYWKVGHISIYIYISAT